MPRLYMGRISSRATERDIERFFKGYGHLREVNLKNGFGFVVSIYLGSFYLIKRWKLFIKL